MLLLFAILPLLQQLSFAQDASVPVYASNTSTYAPGSNATQQLVLGLPYTPVGANDPPIFALTDVASNLPDRDPGTNVGIGGNLWNTNPQTSKNITHPETMIAYISCDLASYSGGNIGLSSVLDDAIAVNVSAILFYSTMQNYCLLNNTLDENERAFGRYYSMVNTNDSMRVLNSVSGMLAANTGTAEIMTQAAYNNVMNGQNGGGIDSTPSTKVAMIILYSITGVITALFLVIIITGAVRAHRHPERYGPHNVLGRPRQSRAKGIARAMLDTIPIVKFGEKQAAKPADIEMAGESSTAHAREAPAQSGSNEGHRDENATATATQQARASRDGAAAAGVSNNVGNDEAQNGENVTCSICTEDFEKGQDIRVLPCDHKFHPACVDPWLLDVSGTCPLCRVDLRPKEEQTNGEASNTQEGQARSSREGEPLPPPLGQERNRRRDTILNFLDRRRMQDSSSDERISALRRWRQATRRSRGPPSETNEQESGQNNESSNQEQR